MKRIVIIGAGFAGLAAAKALKHADTDVVVIDGANHNLFQPLLYQVATTVLSPAQIASPIRGLLKNQRNTSVRVPSFDSANNAPRTSTIWSAGVSSSGTRYSVGPRASSLAPGTSSS